MRALSPFMAKTLIFTLTVLYMLLYELESDELFPRLLLLVELVNNTFFVNLCYCVKCVFLWEGHGVVWGWKTLRAVPGRSTHSGDATVCMYKCKFAFNLTRGPSGI